MTCRAVRRSLQPFLDGMLPQSRARALEAHLVACGACGEEFDALRRVSAALSAEPLTDPPHGMAAEIARRAAAQYVTRRRLLIPAWLEALTLGSIVLALAAAAVTSVSYLRAMPTLHLAPGILALLATAVAASVLAAFGSAYYRSPL